MITMVTLRRPGLRAEITVNDDAVDAYLAQGWQRVDPKKQTKQQTRKSETRSKSSDE